MSKHNSFTFLVNLDYSCTKNNKTVNGEIIFLFLIWICNCKKIEINEINQYAIVSAFLKIIYIKVKIGLKILKKSDLILFKIFKWKARMKFRENIIFNSNDWLFLKSFD